MATSHSTRPLPRRIIQNFHLVWLDGNFDENNEDYRNSITQLRQVVNTVNTFIDVNECIDFIASIQEETTFMISSGALDKKTATVIQDTQQVNGVYIFCGNKARHEQWTKDWPKVKGVFTDIKPICEALKQATQDCDHNALSINFAETAGATSSASKDTLNSSFMYTEILKDILLTIEFDNGHIKDFLTFSREVLVGNAKELKNVDKIQKEYCRHQPIWWYTYDSFLYSMLNRALRLMEVDIIVIMGFFLSALHNDIKELHSKQLNQHTFPKSFVVYRGQHLSMTDFDQLNQNQGGLLAFNNFLSTSTDRKVSMKFLNRNLGNSDRKKILFVMHIDSSIESAPFANIKDVSCYKTEEELLFSMHSVFRIGQIKNLVGTNEIWEVELTLTSDNDRQLRALTEQLQKETSVGAKGWFQLGKLLIKLAQYNKAKELHELLLKQTNDPGEKSLLLHHLGLINDYQGKYAEAVEYYEKSLEISKKSLPQNHPDLAASYNNIGLVYSKMGNHSRAIEYYKKSYGIRKKTIPENHPDFAQSYNNIGLVYSKMGDYSKALEYYDKSLEIMKNTLLENHPGLVTFYNNIGLVYYKMDDYSKALEYYKKVLEISKKSLPENHPSLATSYNNIGLVYSKMGDYSKALEHYEKSLEIRKITLPENHSDMATSYNNIGSEYVSMGDYSKALEYHEKSHEIRKKTLPKNHPDFAQSYNNIGLVYSKMGDYSKALEYYEKSLEIMKNTLPENHRSLATSYNNIGSVYDSMGDYSKALEYYEKSLEIRRKTLRENHPDFTQSYNNIGFVHSKMGDYSKALEYYKKALEICRKTLPENHPSLATSYNNIASVYYSMTDGKKALKYFERALNIWTRSLPPNHPHIKHVKKSIEIVKNKL